MIERGALVEYACFSGNYYGTSKRTIDEQTARGLVVVLDIEMQGVKHLKDSGIDARYVFIRAPSFEVLEERLRARVELEYAEEGAYDKIIVNGDVEEAYKELEMFVF